MGVEVSGLGAAVALPAVRVARPSAAATPTAARAVALRCAMGEPFQEGRLSVDRIGTSPDRVTSELSVSDM
jgi:hypothetical protein